MPCFSPFFDPIFNLPDFIDGGQLCQAPISFTGLFRPSTGLLCPVWVLDSEPCSLALVFTLNLAKEM